MSYAKPRIKFEMSIMDVVTAMSEDNPGVMRVCIDIVQQTPSIDPDNVMQGLGPLLHLDNLDCYGPRIWMLYKDVCNQNLSHMIAVLRAEQFGYTMAEEINAAIDGRITLDVKSCVEHVQARLPAFVVTP